MWAPHVILSLPFFFLPSLFLSLSLLSPSAGRGERGRLELPGRPLLYGTTDAFLRCLNIRSLADLPPLPKNEEAAEQEAPADGGAEA